MMEQKRNNKHDLFDVGSDMKTATKVMCMHMGALRGIKLVGEEPLRLYLRSLSN